MSGTAHRIAEAVSEHVLELSQTRLAELVASYKTLSRANNELGYITGVRPFFANQHEFQEFRRIVATPVHASNTRKNREWGDFQTPPALAKQVCHYLAETGVSPTVVIEPTYGLGNFILAALDTFPNLKLVYGVEVQSDYAWYLKTVLLIRAFLGRHISADIELHQDNIFTHQFPERVAQSQSILIVGNPPWVTSAELGALGSQNLPTKRNIKSLNGMDALTGKSNFDISESILLRLLDQFSTCHGMLAMLCKNSTAKNIVQVLPQKQYRVANIRKLEFDAAREFGVAVEACLLAMDLGATTPEQTCRVASLADPARTVRTFGWVRDRFVANVQDYERNADLDGKSPLVWRQGVKHDCARVMELDARDGTLTNGDSEEVEIEEEYRYWLLKSSDVRHFLADPPRKQVIVTQRRLGEDTARLKDSAPKLWKYLMKNAECLDRRKSSIYRGKPRFAIFGVGDYTFAPYKVAISGLYKGSNFSLVCPIDGRPVMLDDTCYFLGFDTYQDALIAASLFNSAHVKQLLAALVFTDAKRPYTKEVLMRVNVSRAISDLSLESLSDFWKSIGYQPRVSITSTVLDNFRHRVAGESVETRILKFA